jgi:hypothetical protein
MGVLGDRIVPGRLAAPEVLRGRRDGVSRGKITVMAGSSRPLEVGIEATGKKAFAWAVEWPGWCRSGKTEELALEALAEYLPRYREVADTAGVRPPGLKSADSFEVIERVAGDVTTEFGAPGKVVEHDSTPVTAAQAVRLSKLVNGAWVVLDRVAAVAPASLRKGPRGGGRDRDKMLDHVAMSDSSYARKLGVKVRVESYAEKDQVHTLREQILEVLGRASDGQPLVERGWPYRYAARRIAWHTLDHVWEMQDRST